MPRKHASSESQIPRLAELKPQLLKAICALAYYDEQTRRAAERGHDQLVARDERAVVASLQGLADGLRKFDDAASLLWRKGTARGFLPIVKDLYHWIRNVERKKRGHKVRPHPRAPALSREDAKAFMEKLWFWETGSFLEPHQLDQLVPTSREISKKGGPAEAAKKHLFGTENVRSRTQAGNYEKLHVQNPWWNALRDPRSSDAMTRSVLLAVLESLFSIEVPGSELVPTGTSDTVENPSGADTPVRDPRGMAAACWVLNTLFDIEPARARAAIRHLLEPEAGDQLFDDGDIPHPE